MAATSTRRHDVAHQELALEPHGVTRSAASAVAAAVAFPARLGGRCSVLAGNVAQGLGRLAEGGGNLDQLASAGAAVELEDAVLAVLALDRGCTCWTSSSDGSNSGGSPGQRRQPRRHELDLARPSVKRWSGLPTPRDGERLP